MSVEKAWDDVQSHAARLKKVHLRELFASDQERFQALSVELDDLLIDFSKEKLDSDALRSLIELANITGVETKRDALFAGEAWNLTENRAVLHMALRGGAVAPQGDDVDGMLARVLAFAETVRNDGKFEDVINIGIGGSDLGPVMATRALTPDHDGPRVHFVSNVDGAHLSDTLKGLNPAKTLIIVASKSFTTLETMINAHSARDWLAGHAGTNMAAVSTNVSACAEFGIPEERVFGFWDWVGGRYSLWSAIGLPVAIAIGQKCFRQFLEGAAQMDRHFCQAPMDRNLPIILALIGIWRRNAMDCSTIALIPYDQRLERFPAYVQQLDMESNGKSTTRAGMAVSTATGPIVWGKPGTNAQHSFFQLLHQGTDLVPVDFIAAANPRHDMAGHHTQLLANCLAQSQALAFGKTEAEVREEMKAEGHTADDIDQLASHRTFSGDRPSTTLIYKQLDAFSLGKLVALYEHKVFVQGVIWDVNSFDQWGVEFGKQLAAKLTPTLDGDKAAEDLDASTTGLITRIHRFSD